LENAMDAYEGVPTAAQLRELDWAWDDAVAAVTSLNRIVQQDLPRLYDSINQDHHTEVVPAPLPARH